MARQQRGEVPERDWQDHVVKLAKARGWMVYHTYDSRRSTAGWPDLVLLRDGRMIVAELKRESGKLTPEQAEWLKELQRVFGVEAYVWRPSDIAEVNRLLR